MDINERYLWSVHLEAHVVPALASFLLPFDTIEELRARPTSHSGTSKKEYQPIKTLKSFKLVNPPHPHLFYSTSIERGKRPYEVFVERIDPSSPVTDARPATEDPGEVSAISSAL